MPRTPHPAPRGMRSGAMRALAILAVVMLPLSLGLTGCSLIEQIMPPQPPPPVIPDPPDEMPEFFPDGSAEENLPFFTETLRAYSRGDQAIEGRPIVDAVVDAGFAKKRIEVSFDRTKTGLVADNIFVSVRIGKECLIGQFLTGNREVMAELAPAVGPKQKLCLIGETRTVDW